MVSQKLSSSMGVGLYTPAEAARLVRVRPEAISRWVHGNSRGAAVFSAELKDSKERTITFIDLIQCLAIRAVRTQQRRIPLQKIRDAVDRARTEHGIENALARRHSLFAFDGNVVLKMPNEELVGLTGRDAKQVMMVPIVEPFLEEITFDHEGLATRWEPLTAGALRISLDPDRRFGQPVLEPDGILVGALADAVLAEGSIEDAARVHGVHRDSVVLALRYRDHLTGLAAA